MSEANNSLNSVPSQCFSINIVDDDIVEANEAFTLNFLISDPQILESSTASNAVVSIEDNDGKYDNIICLDGNFCNFLTQFN